MSLNRHYDRDLLSRSQQIAREQGLMSRDSQSMETTRIVGVVPSLCENEVYPWDPAVVRAIRRLDPLICPIGVKYICRTPAQTEFTVYRHALASMLPSTPEGYHADLVMNVILPASQGSVNFKARHPMIWREVLEWEDEEVLPGIGAYRPFDWRLFYGSREETRSAREEARDRANQRVETKQKAERTERVEHDYAWDQEIPFLSRQKARLTAQERRDFGRIPMNPEPKPFVHVRSDQS